MVKRYSSIGICLLLILSLMACAPQQQGASSTPNEGTGSAQAAPSGSGSDKPIEIPLGCIYEATGTNAAWGVPRVEALQIVEKQIRDAGGFEVNGQKYVFKIIASDNRGKPDEAVSIAKRLLDTEKVKFLFDGGNSNSSLPVCELMKGRKGVVYMGVSTVGQGFIGKEGYENYFNSWKPDDGDNGIAVNMMKTIKETLPDVKTMAFLTANSSQGNMVVPIYSKYAEANGIKVVAKDFYPVGSVDNYTQLSEIYKLKPDVLFLGDTDEDVKGLLKQALQVGFKTFYTNRVNPGVPDAQSDALGDGYFFGMVDRDFTQKEELALPGVQQYIADYKAIFNKEPDYTIMNRAVSAYEPIYSLAEAMKKAGTVDDTDAIVAALHGMRYEGKIWTVDFDKNGQMTNDYYIYCQHAGQVTKKHIIP